jgi:ATP-binding cassette subfamily C protein
MEISKKYSTFESLKKLFWIFSRKDKFKIFGLFIMMVIGAFLEVLGIGLIPAFILALTTPDILQDYPLIQDILNTVGITKSDDLLIFGTILLIAVYTLKNLYLSIFYYTKSTFLRNRMVAIGTKLFKSYMLAPYTFHLTRSSAELLRNTNIEVKQLVNVVLVGTLKAMMDIIMIAFIFALLVVTEPIISIITFGLLGVTSGIFLNIIKKRVKKYGKIEQQERKHMINSVNQGLGGLKESRVLNKEGFFIDTFWDAIQKIAVAARFKEVANQVTKPFIETLAVVGMLIIILIIIWQGRDIESTIPILALFGAATVKLMPAFKEMVNALTNVRYAIYSVNPVHDDLKSLRRDVRRSEKDTGEADFDFSKKIEVKDLTYFYPDSDTPAVDSINLSIKHGEAIALIGPSGAGKTTFVDIILGLLESTSGDIFVGDMGVKNHLKAWQKHIGYIPQSIFLGDFSIKQNIAWGIPDEEVDIESLTNALEAAQLREFVESLPDGINTEVGERGVRLSGGQRQRIGIARALYHNPDVLIMDEATSALDNETESFVIEAIEKLKGNRTIIMIAHRLSTVKNCDLIYDLRDGKVSRTGTYEELFMPNSEGENV